MTYGIKSVSMNFANNALLWAASGQRLVFGADAAAAPFITIDDSNRFFVGSTNVVSAERQLWPIFYLHSGAPSLLLPQQASMAYISDTQLRFYLRGSDGVTRSATLTMA